MNGDESEDPLFEDVSGSLSKLMGEDDWEVEVLELARMEIAGCKGCFECWIKTPGICTFDDASREITRTVISSDLLVYLTPIVFGGYSYHLKKALDRMISIVHPFFVKVEGEIHHAKRYDRYPSLLGIGIMDEENESEERTFRELVARNAINLHSPKSSSAVIHRNDDLECWRGKLVKALSYMEVIQ